MRLRILFYRARAVTANGAPTVQNGPAVNKLSSNSNNKNMLQLVATGAYHPTVATALSMLKMADFEFENHKKTIFLLVA